jgi:hypothetical protein
MSWSERRLQQPRQKNRDYSLQQRIALRFHELPELLLLLDTLQFQLADRRHDGLVSGLLLALELLHLNETDDGRHQIDEELGVLDFGVGLGCLRKYVPLSAVTRSWPYTPRLCL